MNLKRVLGIVPLWIGGILGIPLIILGITGSVLIYRDEINALMDPDLPARAWGPPEAAGLPLWARISRMMH